jgi:hypothetical protein
VTFIKTAVTPRLVTLRLTLHEAARVTAVVQQNRKTVGRQVFRDKRPGRLTLRIPARVSAGRLVVFLSIVDTAGNASLKRLRVQVQ